MNATDVVAYVYEADYHCEACTEARWPGIADYTAEGYDPADYEDNEGNEVGALFGSSEWWNVGEGCDTLACSDCGAILDNAHTDDCEENYGETPCTLPEEAKL